MRTYRVEIMVQDSVVSSVVVEAILPFKAAEAFAGRPVTIRRQEHEWIRVIENYADGRTFAYALRP